MPTVTGYTAARMQEIEDSAVVDGYINGSGHLILVQHDATEIDAGDALVAVPSATETQEGTVELATSAETVTGTDTARATHPAGVKAVADTKQPLDQDLTDIAALSPTNDDVLQRKAGAWSNRTITQLIADISAGAIPQSAIATLVADLAALTAAIALKAPIASPTFTGTVTTARMINSPVALTDAATIAVDASLSNFFTVTLGGNRAMGVPSNPTNGQEIIFRVKQDVTGNRTLTWTGGAGGFRTGTTVGTPTLSTGANAIDYLTARYDSGGNRWDIVNFVKDY